MNPNTDQRSMRVYASDNTQYKSEPNEEQSRNGVVPLDSLPAAWWNWLWNEITSNNNNALLSITDLRTEIGNVLTNAGLTASAQITNQLAQAIIIIHQRVPFFNDQHNPVPGSVISSAARNSVSVDTTTGQMTVNALSDWASQDSVKTVIDNIVNGGSGSIASLEQAISDEATARENTDGDLNSLTTTDKTDLVAAINEVDGHADDNATAIGDLNSLSTIAKTNLVSAINEVDTRVGLRQYSISEFDTGKKWTDGKKIHGRVLTDLLVRFSQSPSFPTTQSIQALVVFNNTLYVGTFGQGIYTSTNGTTFTQNTSFPTTQSVRAFVVFNNTLYVGTSGQGIYTSTNGTTFTQNTSFPTTQSVRAFAVFNNTLYVGTSGQGTSGYGIYTSTNGTTFTQNTSFPTTQGVLAFVVFNNTLYVGTAGHGIYTSTNGTTFTQNTSFPTTQSIQAFAVFNNTLYVGGNRGFYTSTDGTTFTYFPTFTQSVFALVVFNNTLYVGTSGQGIYTSTNGTTFTQNTSFPTTQGVRAFAVFNNTLYVGTSGHGIYMSGGISSVASLSNISELLFTQLRNAAGPLGLRSAHIDSANHLVVEGDGTPTQVIIEYTKTT